MEGDSLSIFSYFLGDIFVAGFWLFPFSQYWRSRDLYAKKTALINLAIALALIFLSCVIPFSILSLVFHLLNPFEIFLFFFPSAFLLICFIILVLYWKKDISESRRAQIRLIAQYASTRALSEAASVEEASTKILQAICDTLGWDFGSIWMVDYKENHLYCIGVWHQPFLHAQEFEQMTRSVHFPLNIGLPGRVWASGKLAWIDDVVVDPNFPRFKVAKIAGLHSAFGFPILLQNKVLGVLEVFTRKMQKPDEPLLNMLASIGPQIGQFIERKRTENELRESEAHKSTILESALDSIITVNHENLIVSYNPQTVKLFGYEEEELKNKNIDEFIPGLSSKLKQIDRLGAIEFTAMRKNGENFPAELTISQMCVNHQVMYVCVIRDITERKKIEKMKNEFISIVSHELRTPLTSIKGAISLLLGQFVDRFTDKPKQLLEIANNNCDRLIRLINEILDIEKIESGKMSFKFEKINLKDLIHESVRVNEEFAKKLQVKIRIEHEKDVFVSGDYDRLMQVLTNLLSNAIKFSHENGEVIVSMSTFDQFVRILVKDHGKGIPKDFQSKIFGKFLQADSSATRGISGTGLGLSISKAIIESHSGKINFVSREGKGTTFYFDLPAVHEEQTKMTAITPPQSQGLARILICEDDPDCANLLRYILEENHFLVDIAYSVSEAKKLLASGEYAAMTLDIILPDESGINLIKELQAETEFNQIPIIVISAIAKQGQAEFRGNAFPVIGWIEKPIDQTTLNSLINNIKQRFIHKKPFILHVENDPDVITIIRSLLEDHAKLIFAETIFSAKEWLNKEDFDLVILDLNLPDGSGVELLPCINWKTKQIIPVVVFSAYELDQEYKKYVNTLLIKSTTTNEKLIETIQAVIHESKKYSPFE